VGDAGYFKDPITAHGLSDALRDAELLAIALDEVEGGDEALARYESTRDTLSTRLFEITDRVASFEWDNREVKALHRALSDEMKREVREMSALHEARPEPVEATA
jgi:2-polyprenyl-6-methoxyphenol hydroxylase-like FAD-dependent oxidoreductase